MTKFHSLLSLSLVLVCALAVPSDAEAKSFWDAIMGRSSEENGPPPEKTLQAPFIDPNQKKTAAGPDALMEIYEGASQEATGNTTIALNQPHRSPELIADWGSGIVVESLTFSPETIAEVEKNISDDYSTYGLEEYKAYLQKMALIETLKSSNLKLISISNGTPQVLREGVVSGTYHWLVQVPVMASFYDQKLQRIVDKRAKNAQNQEILIQVQVGRTAKKGANDLGIEIERWIVVNQ